MKAIGFCDFISLGRPQWRGQTSLAKALFFLLLGSPDTHTRIRNSHVLNLVERLDLPSHSRVLDVGCGRAVALFWLARRHPDWHLTGVELDPALAGPTRQAIERGHWSNMTIVEGSVAEYPKGEELADERTYDLVLCIDVLEHIAHDLPLLRRLRRALKPGGYLVLHAPRRRQEQWRLLPAFHQHEVDGHIRNEYTAEELRERLMAAGFQLLELRETFGRWGEVSFEFNNLAWRHPPLRYLLAVITYPVAIPTGYWDTRQRPVRGNSFLIAAMRD